MNDKIYTSAPVNKTAALVTNQSGCDDDIFINGEERLKCLGQQKRHYADLSRELKREIGINRKFHRNGNLPLHIRKHPKFQVLLDVMDKLTRIEEESTRIRSKTKNNGSFQQHFIALVKDNYPDIYEEIKVQVFKKN